MHKIASIADTDVCMLGELSVRVLATEELLLNGKATNTNLAYQTRDTSRRWKELLLRWSG